MKRLVTKDRPVVGKGRIFVAQTWGKRLGKSRAAQMLGGNWKMCLLGGMLLAGMITGALIARGVGESGTDSLGLMLSGFSEDRAQQSFFTTLGNSLLSSVPVLLLSFLLGICPAGVLLLPVVPLFRGMGLGVTMGYLYAAWGLTGVGYSALLIIPGAAVSSIAFLFACREGMRLSALFLKSILPNETPSALWPEFRKYLLRFGAFLVLLLIAAITDAFFSAAFSQFFHLSE